VYYVQYAHARIAGILAKAEEKIASFADADVALLVHPMELALVKKMLELPELVQQMAQAMEPHHLPHYAGELATSFHAFYTDCRVIDEEKSAIEGAPQTVPGREVVLARADVDGYVDAGADVARSWAPRTRSNE
jgi:arginyl-tRNA synthetase